MKPKIAFVLILTCLFLLLWVGKVASGGGSTFLPLISNGAPTVTPPTSLELIARALAEGKLDAQTAAMYEVYSLLPDSPLPGEYRGSPDPEVDIAPFDDLRKVYSSLSSEQKAALAPYLARPDDPNSIFYNRVEETAQSDDPIVSGTRPPQTVDWEYLQTSTGVRVHYRQDITLDQVRAQGVVDAINERIYPFLSDMMGRTWMADTGCVPEDDGVVENGGSPDLDIYLMHNIQDRGIFTRCDEPPTPGWIVLNANRIVGDDTHAGMIQTAAHEMLHSIQSNYSYLNDVDSYRWVREATAKWVEDFVFPDAQSEHDYASLYLDNTMDPLDYIKGGSSRYYGEYLWPFYLSRIKGRNVSFVREMFENAQDHSAIQIFTTNPDSTSPVTLFPDFAVELWNQDPYNDFEKEDFLTDSVKIPLSNYHNVNDVDGKTAYPLDPPESWGGFFPRLSVQYYDFVFGDDSARTIAFYNGLAYKLSQTTGTINFTDPGGVYYDAEELGYDWHVGIDVQALVKINNSWSTFDWSGSPYEIFCRDRAEERIQEMVLVVTNSNFQEDQPNWAFRAADENPTVLVSSTGCYRWKGTFEVSDTSDPGLTSVVSGEATFEASTPLVGTTVLYQLIEGNAHLTLNGTSTQDYTYNVDGDVTFPPGEGGSYLLTYNLITGGPHPAAYYGYGTSNQTVKGTYSCYCGEEGEYETYDADFNIGTWLNAPSPMDPEDLNTQSQGNVIDGSYTNESSHLTYHWHLVAQREPGP